MPLVPPLPLPVNVRWRIDVISPGRSATRWLIRVVGDLAERQHGVVARLQLLALGVPHDVIDALVRTGQLRPVAHGVYAVGHRALSEDGRRLAALLACGEDAALSHRTAAAVWNLVDDHGPIHLTVVDGVHRRRPGYVIHRSRTLQPRDATTHRKLAVTRPARTLLDLATVLPAKPARRAMDKALRTQRCSPAALRDAVLRHPGQPGRPVIVRYLADRRASALSLRSELERRGAELLLGSDLPAPRFNAVVEVDGVLLEVDVWWPEARLVLELDGRAYHEGVVAELEDARRDRLLRAAGQRVRRAAWWDVTREPERLLERLGRDLRR